MNELNRRAILQTGVVAASAAMLPRIVLAEERHEHADLRIGSFKFDVTPPLGHSLCGGWITPATVIEDSLEAIGFVILGAGEPIVVCAVDWTGLLNEAHIAWRTALAEAAGTFPIALPSSVFINTMRHSLAWRLNALSARRADCPTSSTSISSTDVWTKAVRQFVRRWPRLSRSRTWQLDKPKLTGWPAIAESWGSLGK